MKIIIIGAGWYGLHSYIFLKSNLKDCDIKILEKDKIFFNNSSNFNQNRLHLGYHYPRSYKTRKLCLNGYKKFINKYREVIDFIDFNYYLIANNSFIDYDTYMSIFSDNHYHHNIIKNTTFTNIDGNIINTKEKIINSNKVKKLFKKKFNKNDLTLGYEVKKISRNDNKIVINDDLECDLLIDCTYNQLNLSKKKYTYELTISLLYDRTNFDEHFESITVMDGPFFSLFPRDISKKTYTLTHVTYTPLIKSNKIEDIEKYVLQKDTVINIKNKMEETVLNIYPNFKKNFCYKSYFTSYKCKVNCTNDSRECIIEENNNIINVNCGKIIGIFEFEEYLKKRFKL